MKLSDVSKVLSFASFRPEPDDSSYSWRKRFIKRKSLLLSLSRDGVAWKSISKEGVLSETGLAEGALKDVLDGMGAELSELSDGGWCSVSINQRYVISLETNLTRKDASNDVLRATPRAILGSKTEKGKRYSLCHNPESNTSALLAVDEEYIKEIEKIFKSSGLKLGRICCGVFAMLEETLHQIQKAKREYEEKKNKESLGGILSVISCNGSVCILKSHSDKWTELRSRVSLFSGENVDSLKKILSPMISELSGEDQIVLNSTEEGSYVKGLLGDMAPHIKINDISKGSSLWKLMSKY